MTGNRLVVHKFGGTSVANAACYRNVAAILRERPERHRAAVVSAMGGVTDTLLRAADLAGRRDPLYLELLDGLRHRHLDTAAELLPEPLRKSLAERIDRDLADIADVLRAGWLTRSHPRSALDLVAGYGELWSAQMLCSLLRSQQTDARWLDAREVLVARPGPVTASVDWPASRERFRAWRESIDAPADTLVITGFIAATPEGVPTTLGRNGSDFSASIFAALLEADEIHIWTDVDGVMTADPRRVPDAVLCPALSYQEAMELAYFGAKVIHPSTMLPAVERSIPIFIRNTLNPTAAGTRIDPAGEPAFAVKGITTIDAVALVNVEGTGMVGVPGIARGLFGALRDAGISVIMISQGSSEHSVCFAVPGAEAEGARQAVEEALFAELRQGKVQTIEVDASCCILAVVGDGMAGHPGVAAKLFDSLGTAGINVRAIAQGSSERNISVVVSEEDTTRALRAVHSGFYLSPQTLSIGVIGTGVVGGALLDQLAAQADRLKQEHNVDLRIRGIINSTRMLLDERQIPLGEWRDRLPHGDSVDPERFVDHIQADYLPHTVLIDCTASELVARQYEGWLRRGIHVITPNKRANTGEIGYYDQLRRTGREAGARYLYETTAGAGLPVIGTLRDLIQTGDEVVRIEGVLSGTLSYLFNAFDGSRPFSAIVGEARRRGFTEPDPRDDLSGMDVARKLVILAREMGLRLELDDVRVDGLVPPGLGTASVAEFMDALPSHDGAMARLRERADAEGKRLQFVGTVDREGNASVGLHSYPAVHSFARLQHTDNIVQFTTRRYDRTPLVVQGPGAGPDVTAGGIFADLLRLASYLGATL